MGLNNVTSQAVLAASAVIAITLVSTFLYKKLTRVKIPTKWDKVGTVKKLHLYPLKSGHRIELQGAEVTDVGLRQTKDEEKDFQLRDRALVVYGSKDNEFRTARTYPKMVFIDVAVQDENHLTIDAPTMRTLHVKIPSRNENNLATIKCWSNEKIQAIDCGEDAATWFSRYIIERDSGLRLAFNDAVQRRDITKTHRKLLNFYKNLGNQSTGLFSDLSSVSLITQQSVDDLNSKIGTSAVTVENFRHNIIVNGPKIAAYDEDNWEWIRIGEFVILRNVKDCTRCIFTTINPENGVRHPQREPLKTLETYRRSEGPGNAPKLGINLEVSTTGFINVGDSVYVGQNQ